VFNCPIPLDILTLIPEQMMFRTFIALRNNNIDKAKIIFKSVVQYVSTNWVIAIEFFKQAHMPAIFSAFISVLSGIRFDENTFSYAIGLIAGRDIETFEWLYKNNHIYKEDIRHPCLIESAHNSDIIFDNIDTTNWTQEDWSNMMITVVETHNDIEFLERFHNKFGTMIMKSHECTTTAAEIGNMEKLLFFVNHGYKLDCPRILISIYTKDSLEPYKDVIKWLAYRGQTMTKGVVGHAYRHKLITRFGFEKLFKNFNKIRYKTLINMMIFDDPIIITCLQSGHFNKYLAILFVNINKHTIESIAQYIRLSLHKAIHEGCRVKCPLCWGFKYNQLVSHEAISELPEGTICLACRKK
jgi:hypothetical protein